MSAVKLKKGRFASTSSVVRLMLVGWLAMLALGGLAAPARSHGLTYSVSELSINDSVLRLELQVQAEAFVAGMNLDGIVTTAQSQMEPEFDRLRSMPPRYLSPMVTRFFRGWAKLMVVEADDVPMLLTVSEVSVPDIGDPERARVSTVVLTGRVPPAASQIALTWPRGGGELLVRQVGVSDPWVGTLAGGESTPTIPLYGPDVWVWPRIVAEFLPIGFTHVLPRGADHVLFMLGLFFFAARLRLLSLQVVTFAFAHLVAVGLAAMGRVGVPRELADVLLALAFMFVGTQNILAREFALSRLLVVFGFGLLHALSFASVLELLDLPSGALVPALLGFNLGVELAQIVVLALAFLCFGLRFRNKPWYHRRVEVPASAAIGIIGFYWLLIAVKVI